MAQGNDYEIWMCFVKANYLIDAKTYEGKCPTCKSPKDCNNYYCLQCKLGGLCPITFRGNGAHTSHCWLQVRRQSHKSAVDPEELAKYMPYESVKHIQKCLLNVGSLCYLRTNHHQALASSNRPPAKRARTYRGQPSTLKSCEACKKAIANSKDCKEDFLLCSVECLITLAQQQPRRNLLWMLDGALTPTNEFPLTALEKIKGRLIGSSSKAPIVIANQSRSSSSGGKNIAEKPPAVQVQVSSDRKSAPVNYWDLHCRGACFGVVGTQVGGASIAAQTREFVGRSSQHGPANQTQAAPKNSDYPLGHQNAGIHDLITEVQANGDWDLYLGNLGRD